ncbi:MAG TPA: VWA domain-containing protein, partial [Vicinamibacteria bacterium]|nr:VWA domain-containing protein [Vicinamibacteria bacterium]
MSFASPAWLFGLLALPVLALAEALLARRDAQRASRFVARPLWARVVRRPAASWRWARVVLLLVGTAGLVLALARPEWGVVREKVEREGVDVVLAIDSSGSMATEDVSPSRFFIARNALQSLVGELDGDRIGLLAFEGEAYPLVPLTLDADAVGLFLETLEPGIVPSPGSSLGVGLAKGLEMFVDKERRNKALVLVSDGEDLEGDVEDAIRKAKEAGVVVHTVGVGTERGQPVPDFDREGNRTGFKKDEAGSVVVSRLHAETLEAMARGTGGTYIALSPTNASLASVAAAIEGMERKTLAREWSYRKRERYQVPLGIGLACLTLALLLPPFPLRRARAFANAAAVVACALLAPGIAFAADAKQVAGEIVLKPKRLTQEGRGEFERGNHPAALQAFEKASHSRPQDPAARFNLADGLYKNGKFDEAAAIYESLGAPGSGLAPQARFNLGNARFQKQDFAGAAAAYKDALRLKPGDTDTVHNLELALRALQQQKQEQQKQQDQQKKDDQKQDKQRDQQSKQQDDKQKDQKQQPGQQPERPKTEEEKEKERFQKETGMPKERAMQLLDALQQNEKDEQKRLLAAKAQKKTGRDW